METFSQNDDDSILGYEINMNETESSITLI